MHSCSLALILAQVMCIIRVQIMLNRLSRILTLRSYGLVNAHFGQFLVCKKTTKIAKLKTAIIHGTC